MTNIRCEETFHLFDEEEIVIEKTEKQMFLSNELIEYNLNVL